MVISDENNNVMNTAWLHTVEFSEQMSKANGQIKARAGCGVLMRKRNLKRILMALFVHNTHMIIVFYT